MSSYVRRLAHASYLEALREGRKTRAVTIQHEKFQGPTEDEWDDQDTDNNQENK